MTYQPHLPDQPHEPNPLQSVLTHSNLCVLCVHFGQTVTESQFHSLRT
jgi:hypothetical protein